MGRLGRDYHRRKLTEMLSVADAESFAFMISAVDLIQSGGAVPPSLFAHPPEAATTNPRDRYFVHKWRLETLTNEYLRTAPQVRTRRGGNRSLNCFQWRTLAKLIDTLNNLENAEDGIFLQGRSVLDEMPRIAHKQFEWQRGFLNIPHLYRWLYIFGAPECEAYFTERNGLSLSEFCLSAILICSAFKDGAPYSYDKSANAPTGLEDWGLTREALNAALKLLAREPAELRAEAAEAYLPNVRTSYQPSILRRYPCIAFGTQLVRVRAPIQSLVVQRSTQGVYYDLVGGTGGIRNAIASRFESYCLRLLNHFLADYSVAPQFKYTLNGQTVDTIDILVSSEEGLILAIECKAKWMALGAKYGDDPMNIAKDGFGELVTGVVQLWKFFSRCRRGLVPNTQVTSGAMGLVLTLESWLAMSRGRYDAIIAEAKVALQNQDEEVLEQDMRPCAFAQVEDVEHTLRQATANTFLDTVRASANTENSSWLLPLLHNRLFPEIMNQHEYPFLAKMDEVLPWFSGWKAR